MQKERCSPVKHNENQGNMVSENDSSPVTKLKAQNTVI